MTTPSSSSPQSTVVPTSKTRSFKDVLAGSSSTSSQVKFMQTSFKGYPALMFDDSVVSLLADPFTLTMHGHNMEECFKRHPNLKKEKVQPKVDPGKALNIIHMVRSNEDQNLSKETVYGKSDCNLVLNEQEKETVNGDISLHVVLPIEKMSVIHK
ncbi:hypothetical protein MA16_Dca026075 [Dendrobium catenatum]|uniref:Uncharacterized protein n=1 Tax=Dendrobium catenatum TaxID=906689 RepID=A0A2I0X6I8_9ASPA|nr:hypothetical protein MA16_Dca026075 [Dendrobium catenatum]